jgi:hypothetical protein
MSVKIRRWFEPPAGIEDEEQSRQAAVLNGVAWAALGITLVLGPALWWVGAPPLVLALLLPLALAEILVLILLRRGKVRAASLLLVLVALLTTLLPAFFQGGLSSPYLYYSLVIVVLAGLLLGARYVNLITAVFMAAATFMLLAADTSLLPELISPPTPLRRWVTVIASLFMVRTLFLMAINGLQAALERARQNEQRLQESNRALEETRLALEQRVAERTAALEQRARQLQASAEVVSAINAAMSVSRWFRARPEPPADRDHAPDQRTLRSLRREYLPGRGERLRRRGGRWRPARRDGRRRMAGVVRRQHPVWPPVDRKGILPVIIPAQHRRQRRPHAHAAPGRRRAPG